MIVALGDISETIMGQAPPGKECNKEGVGTVFVKAGEFGKRHPIIREWTTKPLKHAKSGDVLICVVGATAGKINLGIECAIGRSVAAIRPKIDKLDVNYLHYFMRQEALKMRRKSQGLAQGVITKKMLADLPIPLPPLSEQKRIAAILDQADALRRQRQRALDQLNQLGQSIFYEMFGDPIKNTKSFRVVKLADAGTLDRGISKHRPRNHPALLGGAHPLVQTGDVSNAGDYLRTYSKTYSEIGLRQSKKWAAGTLCITIAANIANTAILDFDACFPDSVVGFIPNEKFSSLYIHYWFKSVRENIERLAPAVAQKNINLKTLRELDIIAPSKSQQDLFAKRLEVLEENKVVTLRAKKSMEALFNSLQHGLFSGEIKC